MRTDSHLLQDRIAVTSFDDGTKEQVIAIVEVNRNFPQDSYKYLLMNIQRAVFKEQEIALYDIAIIQYGTIAKTTSGKIQRKENLVKYLNQTLTKLISYRDIYEQR